MKNFKLYSLLLLVLTFLVMPNTNALENSGVLQQNQKIWLYFDGTKFISSNSNTSDPGYPNFSYKHSDTTALICESGIYVDFEVGATCNYDSNYSNSDKSIGVAYLINDFTGVLGGKQWLEDSLESYYWLELSTLYYLGKYTPQPGKNFMNNVYDKITLTNGKTFAKTQQDAKAYAEKYSKAGYSNPVEINLSANEIVFTNGNDGYYYSQKIYVTDVNNNMDLSKSSISDTTNFILTESTDSNGKFYQIKISKDKVTTNELSVSLTVSGSYEYYKAQIFDCSQDYQNVISTLTNKVSDSETKTISGKIVANSVTIKKVDSNNNYLKGATLEIQDENGNIVNYCQDENGNNNAICRWVSTDKPYEIEDLPIGKYYLVETIAPEGYELNKEKVLFEIKGDGTITDVVMKNQLYVEVPDTLSARSSLLLAIAMFDIALGIGIITYVKKNKIKE